MFSKMIGFFEIDSHSKISVPLLMYYRYSIFRNFRFFLVQFRFLKMFRYLSFFYFERRFCPVFFDTSSPFISRSSNRSSCRNRHVGFVIIECCLISKDLTKCLMSFFIFFCLAGPRSRRCENK